MKNVVPYKGVLFGVLFFVLFFPSVLFAEVSQEDFNALSNRISKLEEIVNKLVSAKETETRDTVSVEPIESESVDQIYDRVGKIEEDVNKIVSEKETGRRETAPAEAIDSESINDRISYLEGAVGVLKDRHILFDFFSDEIRKDQEYVCLNDHVLPVSGDNNRCPVCGAMQRSRIPERVFSYARRESIAQMISAAFEEEFAKRVLLGANGTGILQQLVSSDVKEENFVSGSFDLIFITQPLPRTTFFIDIEAIGGNGPDELIGSVSGLNADAGSQQDDDGLDRVSVREVWLGSELFDNRLSLVAGKIDLGNYFDTNALANDETTQFITNAFVNSASLEQPDLGPGLVAFFDTKKGLNMGLGLQSNDNSGLRITDELYAIAEIGYTTDKLFSRKGTYRIWGRINGDNDDNKGFGVSIDQEITNRIALFGRYGANENDPEETEIASAWSTGLRMSVPFLTRFEDEVAIAFGQIDKAGGDYESSTELYYKVDINEHLSLSTHFQTIFDPAGVGSDDTAMVAGFRTQVNF
ncbi:MAG: carbohydrate porin [Candidatus Jettenia sp.]|nr:carbohydrate porin [Candidatus Jettenia sp.]